MKQLAGDAEISFEGDLNKLHLLELAGASTEETEVLKRNTLWPRQDFVVVPLTATNIAQINAAMGGTIPRSILHVQIARGSRLEFGAYDNFAPGNFFPGDALNGVWIASLETAGVIERCEA